MKQLLTTAAMIAALPFSSAIAEEGHYHHHHDHARPDAHAPIGVMRDHVHQEGEAMLSYRFEYMHMDGNIDGDSNVSTQEVLQNYMVAPTSMPMKMHMLGAMYGVTDQLTLGVMTNWISRDMDHTRRNGTTFVMENDGWADTAVNAMYEFYNDGTHRIQANAGISLPTGSVNDLKPNGQIFGYAMQTGSGTYDLLPGVSYSGLEGDWSWGGQANAVLRLGENERDYTFGNSYQLTGWGARRLNDMFSVSLRLDGRAWETIDGEDRDLTGPNFMAPPLDANLYSGERLDAAIGVNFIVPEGHLKGHRLAAEFSTPVYQRLDGPRLETDYILTLGWQKAF
jgi:hypothetical protein